jgi:hypothetical protein
MRIVHLDFVLIDGLLCMILRTIAPYDCWFYLILWLRLTWVYLTWYFGGFPRYFTQDVVHFMQDATCLM